MTLYVGRDDTQHGHIASYPLIVCILVGRPINLYGPCGRNLIECTGYKNVINIFNICREVGMIIMLSKMQLPDFTT